MITRHAFYTKLTHFHVTYNHFLLIDKLLVEFNKYNLCKYTLF